MVKIKSEKKIAIIVIHEIYGVNKFIKDQCQKYQDYGYDVYCPDLIGRTPFLYEESEEAYEYFNQNVGFQVYKKINNYVQLLKERYDKVFLMGFSVGATIAWKCCENTLCSGIIACYGSRIREYTDLSPVCPTFLLFAKEDSFDVSATVGKLREKPNLTIMELEAKHGFLDSYSKQYNQEKAKVAKDAILNFMSRTISLI
jgi:dienelactone hydrolase